MNTLVIDTNIIIAALIKKGMVRKILTNSSINFIFPDCGLEEIYKYQQEIREKSGMNEREFNIILLRILKYVRLIPLEMLAQYKEQSDRIMENIDKKDSIFIAAALAFNCGIWSDDRHFRRQDKTKILTTKELISLSK